MFCDAHTHLNHEMLFADWEKYLTTFIAQGGKGLVTAGANAEYNTKALHITNTSQQRFPECFVKCAIGFHPCDLQEISEISISMQKLRDQILAHSEVVVAIGECGIDLHYPDSDSVTTLDKQQEVFNAQCQLARDMNLPLMIHSRDAFEETLEILKAYSDLTLYFHCWGYGEEELKTLLTLFPKLFIGFCWNTTYPKAEALRQSLMILPLENILIETDAPYLTPVPLRGQTNLPEYVTITGNYCADLKGYDQQYFWEQIFENFMRLYWYNLGMKK